MKFRAPLHLRPITVIGSDAFKAFIFHIVVIFGVYRFLLEAWQVYAYPQVMATAGWIALTGTARGASVRLARR